MIAFDIAKLILQISLNLFCLLTVFREELRCATRPREVGSERGYSMIGYRVAIRYKNRRIELPDKSVISIVIWILPSVTEERPHGYKYRLNYSSADGTTLLRYDNKTGKGDHRHINGRQILYTFVDVDQLLEDFWKDFESVRAGLEREGLQHE